MKLHENKTEFRELITLTAREKHIPESAVERDYFISGSARRLRPLRWEMNCGIEPLRCFLYVSSENDRIVNSPFVNEKSWLGILHCQLCSRILELPNFKS